MRLKVLLMYRPSEEHLQALKEAGEGKVTFSVAGSKEEAWRLVSDVTVVMGNRFFLQSLPNARNLRWMQSNSVGVDLILTAGDRLQDVILTCAKGIYDNEMSDHALALILALTRQLHLIRDEQIAHRWLRRNLPQLTGMRAMILGWGGVGQGIGTRLKAFGVEVMVLRRSHSGPLRSDPRNFHFAGPSNWKDQLSETDLLVLALPRTSETERLVGERELAMLPSHAFVVNVGRGETIDQEALLRALKRRALSGAALDVFEQEPPPVGDPVWEEPNLIITPHVARSMEEPPFRWEPLFVENLRRFVRQEPLLNVVDKDQGY